jgi:hypothetical protein
MIAFPTLTVTSFPTGSLSPTRSSVSRSTTQRAGPTPTDSVIQNYLRFSSEFPIRNGNTNAIFDAQNCQLRITVTGQSAPIFVSNQATRGNCEIAFFENGEMVIFDARSADIRFRTGQTRPRKNPSNYRLSVFPDGRMETLDTTTDPPTAYWSSSRSNFRDDDRDS